MKNEFMKIYESLCTLNEATNYEASKKFWAAAKNKQIDEVAFHTAYDEELTELGLIDLFNTDGTLLGKGTYNRIKIAKEVNPTSWAVKALSKLWVLRYVDNILFSSEISLKDPQAKKATEVRVGQEKRTPDFRRAAAKEYRALLPDALAAIKPELINKYLEAYNITKADIDFDVIQTPLSGPKIVVLPTRLYSYPLKSNDVNLRIKLISMLANEFEGGIRVAEKGEAEKKA